MELLTLSLENFQGLKHEEIQLDGHSASIYGRNASGKTTIFNAITWLLFGKPSTWAKNWDPRQRPRQSPPAGKQPRHSGTLRSRIFKWTFGPLPAAAAETPIGYPTAKPRCCLMLASR